MWQSLTQSTEDRNRVHTEERGIFLFTGLSWDAVDFCPELGLTPCVFLMLKTSDSHRTTLSCPGYPAYMQQCGISQPSQLLELILCNKSPTDKQREHDRYRYTLLDLFLWRMLTNTKASLANL